MAQTNYTPISLYYSSTSGHVPTAGNLVNGELAINIADGILFYKNASGVVTPFASGGAPATTDFTAGAGQTTFTLSYTVGNLEVYRNGVKLGIADFTATNGTSFTLATGAAAGDLIEAVTFTGTTTPGGVTSISVGSGMTASGSTGAVTLGLGSLGNNRVWYGNSTGVASTSANLAFDGTSLTVANVLNAPSINGATTLGLSTGGTTAVTVDASQNVGVGTTSPGSKLQVTSASDDIFRLSATAPYLSFYNGSTRTGYIRSNTSGVFGIVSEDASTPMAFYTANTERMRIDSSGNVGIGTSSPSTGSFNKQLTINSGASTYAGIVLQNNATGTAFNDGVQLATDGTNALIHNYESGNMIFNNAGSERMRIDSSGNLLVGTTSNAVSARISTSYSGVGIALETNSTTTQYACSFRNNNGTVGSISTNGSTTTYATSSDYRLKENVAPMVNALDTIAQLNPVTYKWKSDGSDGQGFIAHELQAVVPDCVTGEKDAVDEEGKPVYQGIDTSFLVATLTAAIQEQQAIITQQAADIAALKAKVGI